MGTKIHMIKKIEVNWILMINGILFFLCFCFFWAFTNNVYISEAGNFEAVAVVLAIFCFMAFLISIALFLCSIESHYLECKCNKYKFKEAKE